MSAKNMSSIAIGIMLLLISGCKSSDWINYTPIDFCSAPVEFDDSQAKRRLRVAAASLQPEKYDKGQTLKNMENIIKKIKSERPQIQVIVFGETILGWYFDPELKGSYQAKIAETIPGNSTETLKRIAIENNVNLIWGMTEKDTIQNARYNAQVFIRNTGELTKYRKINLGGKDPDNGISRGDNLPVFDIGGFKAVMFICSDMQSEEMTAKIAEIKPDVIFHSLSTTTSQWSENVNVLGRQFNTWIIFANRFGNEGPSDYDGFSCIIDPAGKIRERCFGQNSYVYREIGAY